MPPPYIHTNPPDSFAGWTFRVRIPVILDQVLENNPLPEIRRAVTAFKQSLISGTVQDPFAGGKLSDRFDPQEMAVWKQEFACYAGSSWQELPFYFAEAAFYLHLLLAYGYYDPDSPNFGRDPFAHKKLEELTGSSGALKAAAGWLRLIGENKKPLEKLRTLLYLSLWSNRIDLSVASVAGTYRQSMMKDTAANLLIDDGQSLSRLLPTLRYIHFILDNTGHELICDLLLISTLLDNLNLRIVTHVKQSPIFVSDTTARDLRETVRQLSLSSDSGTAAVGRTLADAIETGRLRVQPHFFWNGPLHFPDLPADLKTQLAQADLVFVKGDANYRRLLSDRRWPHHSSISEITGYFPASFALLRTLKSEIIVGLSGKRVRHLEKTDPNWLINGSRGLIQLVLL